ncbi:MAG TPA: BTAD domain-containing putative transcriptional regulator [Pseudonocardiaceae bacterium]|nr:BTAD domain-containing putative transcriptional regulator [Pseudonocardiaceae bacterium]
MIRIRLFGATEVTDVEHGATITDFRGVKARQILAILALHSGQYLSKAKLARLLWDDRTPDSWHSTLEGYVSVLRRTVEPGVRPAQSMIITQRGSYRVRPERIVTDLAEFDALVDQAAQFGPPASLPKLLAALALARGEVLAAEQWAWLGEIRARYQQKVAQTYVRAGQQALALGDAEAAAELGRRARDLDSLDEQAWTLMLEAFWMAGRRSDGLRCFATLRTTLATELGVAPGRRAQRLHELILHGEPGESAGRGLPGGRPLTVA